MKAEPEQRLDPRAKLLWRLTGTLQAVPIFAGGVFGSYVLTRQADAPYYLAILPVLVALVVAVLLVFVLPPLLWRWWRYEIRPLEVDLQRGLLRVTRTLVPMARVHFYTAVGPNEIPQLAQKTAAKVRDRIAELTRTADEL